MFEKTVCVWGITTSEKIIEFATILDFGGTRLALAHWKDAFVAGAYTRFGIACYRLTDGAKLWHRNDLKGVQKIRISPNDKIVFCGFSDKPGHILDFDTGVTLEKLRGAGDIFFDPYQSWRAYSKNAHIEVSDSKGMRQTRIQKTHHVFEVVFSPDYITLSGKQVQFISRQDFNDSVYYRSPLDSHVLCLAYSPKCKAFFGDTSAPFLCYFCDTFSRQMLY